MRPSHGRVFAGTPPRRRGCARRLVRLLGAVAILLAIPVALFWQPDLPAAEVEALYAQPPSEFVELLGSRVHVRDEGLRLAPDTPTFLLIHGTASSLHTWDGWVDELGDAARIVRFDLQGYGLTGPNPNRDYSIERQIAVGEALLDHLGVGQVTIAGNSLGGLVAWRWALAHPDRVERLILVDAAGYPRSESGADTGGGTVLELTRMPLVKDVLGKLLPRSLVESGLRDVYGDADLVTDQLVDRHFRMLLREGNREALVDAMSQRVPNEHWKRIPEITQPTLILWGGRDDWIPVHLGTRFDGDLPDSTIEVFPDLGHVPMEEDPAATAAVAREWLADLAIWTDQPAPTQP